MELSATFMFLVPVIIGLVMAFRKVGLATKFAPILSIVTGIALAYFFVDQSTASVLQGVVAGLMASGLWSGTKATLAE